ncbi:MAG: hypothetical protein KJ077_06290 [Anaerolineae bacterium]|nr:hypothetical protein [Anaerolineae bacterium]
MKSSSAINLYKKFYSDLQFERAGLFQAVQEKYNCQHVLYPGSFVHITPSFFFPHVVYIDRDPKAQAFFADRDSVSAYINSRKTYKRSAYFRFIAQDYTAAVPRLDEGFDLLISLYAGRIYPACQNYLKLGGLLLTNNHHHEGEEAAGQGEFKWVAVVQFRKNKYTVVEENLDRLVNNQTRTTKAKRYLKQSNYGVTYTENEVYYIYQRG